MNCQLEVVSQKVSKHPEADSIALIILLVIVERTQLLSYGIRYFRLNVVSFRFDPTWCSKDSTLFELVGLLDEILRRGTRCRECFGRKPPETVHGSAIFVWFDRNDIKLCCNCLVLW